MFGFVPSYLLPKKRPASLDPFMEPFIRDIEEGFINGIQVNYAVPVCEMPAGPCNLRHLVLCCSGDHMGLCELGKFVKCGKKGCRRCETTSVYFPASRHYYYTNNRYQTRFPPQSKDIVTKIELLKEIEEEERVTIREQRSKECGYTGLSILHRLWPLYGFRYDKDLVFDEMHTVLNSML